MSFVIFRKQEKDQLANVKGVPKYSNLIVIKGSEKALACDTELAIAKVSSIAVPCIQYITYLASLFHGPPFHPVYMWPNQRGLGVDHPNLRCGDTLGRDGALPFPEGLRDLVVHFLVGCVC